MSSSSSTTTTEEDNDLLYIDVSKFTRNVKTNSENHTVSGDGIFDILMNTATSHLLAQFDGNRIRNEDYATAYVQVYQTTLNAALQVFLQRGIAEKQQELIDAQIEAEKAKMHLYRRQIEGFDEDYKQKILKICMDSWAVGFSVAKDSFEASGIPAPMTKSFIDDLLNDYIVPDLDNYDYGRPWLIVG